MSLNLKKIKKTVLRVKTPGSFFISHTTENSIKLIYFSIGQSVNFRAIFHYIIIV